MESMQNKIKNYSETRVGVSRRQRFKVDATITERRPSKKFTRAAGTLVSL